MSYRIIKKKEKEIQELHNYKKGASGVYYLDEYGWYYEVLHDGRISRIPKTSADVIAGGGSLEPTGPAGGDLTGDYPDPELITVVSPGTYGGDGIIPQIKIDKKGRIINAINKPLYTSPDVIIDGGTIISPTENVLIDGGAI